MDPAPVLYAIRIHGHLGATVLSAFPALVPQHHGADTVLTGLLDRSALYGVLANSPACCKTTSRLTGPRSTPGRTSNSSRPSTRPAAAS